MKYDNAKVIGTIVTLLEEWDKERFAMIQREIAGLFDRNGEQPEAMFARGGLPDLDPERLSRAAAGIDTSEPQTVRGRRVESTPISGPVLTDMDIPRTRKRRAKRSPTMKADHRANDILAFVRKNPGSSAGEITTATGATNEQVRALVGKGLKKKGVKRGTRYTVSGRAK